MKSAGSILRDDKLRAQSPERRAQSIDHGARSVERRTGSAGERRTEGRRDEGTEGQGANNNFELRSGNMFVG